MTIFPRQKGLNTSRLLNVTLYQSCVIYSHCFNTLFFVVVDVYRENNNTHVAAVRVGGLGCEREAQEKYRVRSDCFIL